MATQEGANQKRIITFSVMAGLTPLIPIPLVDDLAGTHFKRRMTRELAASYEQTLTEADVKVLSDDAGSGCLRGCLIEILLYPLKWIFRKIFIFLEWKRAIDIATRAYYQGYLIDYALDQRWIAPAGAKTAAQARAAIDRVLAEVNTSLIERAVKETFSQSKSVLKGAARMLQTTLRRLTRSASEEQVEQAIEPVEQEEEREVEGVVARLQGSIGKIPADHFDRLRRMLEAEMGKEG
ncbi:MAG: hypothetical protein AB1631_11530 [Acidobacteriota bacterium]